MRLRMPVSGGRKPPRRSTFQTPSSGATAVAFLPVPGLNFPFPPMEAQLVRSLPDTDGWQFEPKWDGFRGVLENDGGELALWSRNERPLLRYFPELRPLGDLLPPHSALDGEIVIARDGALDFDSMQTRLHPAESRIRRLSAEIPAEFVVFDVLLWTASLSGSNHSKNAAHASRHSTGFASRRARARPPMHTRGSTVSNRWGSTASSRKSSVFPT